MDILDWSISKIDIKLYAKARMLIDVRQWIHAISQNLIKQAENIFGQTSI
jgi:hypothetical protein